MKSIIETKRLILRELKPSDVEGMYALDSNADVHAYLGNTPVKTREESQQTIKFIREQYKENGIARFAVIDKQTNSFMGWCGLKYESDLRIDKSYYDIGYRLRKRYWGGGVATEAAIACLNYGFSHMNLTEISGAAHTQNIASNIILRKIGLTFVETFAYKGIVLNWYTITQDQWLNR